MIDSGWKCSVPTCGTTSALEIDHIEEWSEVKEHKYENLIVLCPTHHSMKQKSSNPRDLNAKALHVIKQNQLELAGRYGDVERRVLGFFVRNPDARNVFLPGDFDVLLMHLLDATLLEKDFSADGSMVMKLSEDEEEPTPENSITIRQAYRLTAEGQSAVMALREARSLNDLRD
jgi:hypothetical protein